VDRLVLVVAAHEGDGLATRPRDGEASDRDELALLEPEGVRVGALDAGSPEYDAANWHGGISLKDDPVGLGRPREAILPRNGYLFQVGAGLNLNRIAGGGGNHGSLDRRIAR
jgi:hypothetical protein